MKKWILLILAGLLLSVVLFFYISFNGNFISKMVAKSKIEDYVAQTYEEENVQLIDSGFNFKDGRYYFDYDIYNETIRSTYTFSIGGPFIPKGRIFSYLDYQSTDEYTNTEFQQAGQAFIEQQLKEQQLAFTWVNYYVSVPKSFYDKDAEWQPQIDKKLMPTISIELKDEQQTEAQFLEQAQHIRELLEEQNVTYAEVNISVMREYDNSDGAKEGYAETYYEGLYSTDFTPDTKQLTIN